MGPDVKCGPDSKCGPVIRCAPNDGVSDDGSLIGSFDCTLPEPGTAALLGLGVVGLVLTARRRRSRTR